MPHEQVYYLMFKQNTAYLRSFFTVAIQIDKIIGVQDNLVHATLPIQIESAKILQKIGFRPKIESMLLHVLTGIGVMYLIHVNQDQGRVVLRVMQIKHIMIITARVTTTCIYIQ